MHHDGVGIEQISEWGEAHTNAPATQRALRAAQERLGHGLPDDLRVLLEESDGIQGEYDLALVWPVDRIAQDNFHFRTNADFADLYMPFDGLLFFADAGNGDQFFVSLSGNNEVYVWDHEDDSRTWVASTVLGYLEGWMRGHLKV